MILQNSEPKVWQDYKNGNIEAFSYIYEAHYRALYAYGHCFTSEDDLIKDCIQELFSELWQNRIKVAQVTKIRPYLMVYLKRKILS